MTLINLKDLEAHLWHAAHIITGPIDASDYKTYIFPILFFKRICDVYDEEFEEAMEQVMMKSLREAICFTASKFQLTVIGKMCLQKPRISAKP